MASTGKHRVIQTRKALFHHLNSRLLSGESFGFEDSDRGLVKSYIFEVISGERSADDTARTREIETLFRLNGKRYTTAVQRLEEQGFYQVTVDDGVHEDVYSVWLDTATNPRFWIAYSISDATFLRKWFARILKRSRRFDFVWLWPEFLEHIQRRGVPRGFGLDYDYRRFADGEAEITSYLKMQIWGGAHTHDLYKLLKSEFAHEIILSRIRMKQTDRDSTRFAIQALGYHGSFHVRGTDFGLHNATVNYVRNRYESVIMSIESTALSWIEFERGRRVLQGYAIHFLPVGASINVARFYDSVFDGTMPFRLAGVTDSVGGSAVYADVVDLHTGSELQFEIYPDVMTIYLRDGTCGNTIARFYTNLQHYYGARFIVESDNGIRFFESPSE